MTTFIFDSYAFSHESGEAIFRYTFDDGRSFEEKISFPSRNSVSQPQVLDAALRLAFLLVGTSYAKTFPTVTMQLPFSIDQWTADFLNKAYQEGLGQFAYENNLTRHELPHFQATSSEAANLANVYDGSGVLALQSGGKDSLLVAALLKEQGIDFIPWYVTSNPEHHPSVLDSFDQPLAVAVRSIDKQALLLAREAGGKNGHVPVTYIVQSFALIQAILLGKNEVLVSIAHEGEEAHAEIGDLSITHQWSKTWPAEQLFAEYTKRYISPDIKIGSPIRQFSELKVAELFVEKAWQQYGLRFSSCNVANYRQGVDNTELTWCGDCPKCANSYLLFAPYLAASELKALFHGRDLFIQPRLQETFKGLLGVDGVVKPFECVGEIDELRYAYHEAQHKGGYESLPFIVPASNFDVSFKYPAQHLSLHL